MSFWDWRFLLPLVFVLTYVRVVYHYATPPKKRDLRKGRNALEIFERKVNGWKDDKHICQILDRYSVRYICHLRVGLQDRIFDFSGCDTTMSLREEEALDSERHYYEHILELTEAYLPPQYIN